MKSINRTFLKNTNIIRKAELLDNKTMAKVTDIVFGEDSITIEKYNSFEVCEITEDIDADDVILGTSKVEEILESTDMYVTALDDVYALMSS